MHAIIRRLPWLVVEGSLTFTMTGPDDINQRSEQDSGWDYLMMLKQHRIVTRGWVSTWRYYASFAGSEINLMILREVRRVIQKVTRAIKLKNISEHCGFP